MPETIHLGQSPGWVNLGTSGIRVQAPSLQGDLVWHAPEEHIQTLAAAGPGAPDQIEQSLREAGLSDQGLLAIPSGTASFAAQPTQVLLEAPIPDDQIQFAIYRDESGVISLHQPVPSAPIASLRTGVGSAKAAPGYHYLIPLRRTATPTAGRPRMGMLGGIFGNVIRFVGKAATGLAEGAVFIAAKTWENQFRKPQGFHLCRSLPELLNPAPAQMGAADFESVKGNKALLFIHGTISSTSDCYTGLNNFLAKATQLFEKYGGRVIGFNHHTLTKSVSRNAIDFLSALPAGSYQFDVISHSRGGLLARALKELTTTQLLQLTDVTANLNSGVDVSFGNIVLVGTPNMGTPLANPTDLPKAVSRLASMATSFSQDAAEFGLGALLAIFGGIVEGGVAALPGLEDMNPGNPFLVHLNSASNDITPYYGITADFLPTGGLATAILDNGVDALFQGVANDLVVPTAGVSEINGQTLPTARVDQYSRSANVYHTDYFYQQGTWDAIANFLA